MANPLDLREFSVERRPLGDVRPYENNPRINDGAVDASLDPETLAKILSAASERRVDVALVERIARDGGLLDADGKIAFLNFVAFMINRD